MKNCREKPPLCTPLPRPVGGNEGDHAGDALFLIPTKNVARWKSWEIFLELRYSIKARQSQERVSVATKLEPNTFKRLINNLTLSGFFQLIVRNKIE